MHSDTSLSHSTKRTNLTTREWLAFRLQDRNEEKSPLMYSKRLLLQFIVDGYTIESQRLRYIRTHQEQLRVDLYKGLTEVVLRGDVSGSSIGSQALLAELDI